MGTYVAFLRDYEKKLRVKKIGPTITVSGVSGVGKSTVGEAVAKAFKLKLISMGDIFRSAAAEKGLSLHELSQKVSPELDYYADQKALEYAMRGNVVLVGRLTAWVAGDHADYKVWVDCSLDVRAQRVAKRDKISIKDAEKVIKLRDEADARRYRNLYGIDEHNTSIYDLTINTAHLSFEATKELPVDVIKLILRDKGWLK